jgi:hypothetical protein
MNEERKQVLTMLAEGKISAEDAERLLDKLDNDGTRGEPRPASSAGSSVPKYLRVHVDSSEGDKVNVRVPLALIKTGIKLTALMPTEVNEKLAAEGIDLGKFAELNGQELFDALRELQVDVDSSEGDTVRVFCE